MNLYSATSATPILGKLKNISSKLARATNKVSLKYMQMFDFEFKSSET